MTKERINVSIEKDLVENAKKHIPNLSGFFEECLKYYLGLVDGTYPITEDQEILKDISKLQAKLFINRQNFDVQENMKRVEDDKKDRAWRFLFNDYRITKIIDKDLMETAVNTLGVDEITLEDIMDEAKHHMDTINTNIWETVYEWYQKEMML